MVEIDNTCMEAVEARVKFIKPMRYKMSVELIEGYAQIILHSEKDIECPRWGTYEEKMREVHYELHIKERKKKEEKVIDSILKESGMTQEEFNEVKGIALEIKLSGQSKVIETTPIVVAAPSKGVTIAKPSAQAPYEIVVQVKLVIVQLPKRQSEVIQPITQRKLERLVKVEQKSTPPTKKRVKQTPSGPEKRRKILQVSDSKKSKDEIKDRPVEKATQEGRTPARKKDQRQKTLT